MAPDGRPGARRKAPGLPWSLTCEVQALRDAREQMWALRRQEAKRLRALLPRIVEAGYSHRAAAALLGISYATVQSILRGKPTKATRPQSDGLALSEKPGAD